MTLLQGRGQQDTNKGFRLSSQREFLLAETLLGMRSDGCSNAAPVIFNGSRFLYKKLSW